MPRKTYTEQFKRDAVSLYESTPGATLNAIASDLGVNRNSLRTWLDAFGTGTKTNANGEKVASPIAAANSARTPAEGLSDAERIPRAGTRKRQAPGGTRDSPQGGQIFRGRDELVNRFRFVDDNRGLYEVKRLCEVLKINRSSYYKWKSAAPARRRRVLDDAVLGARIKAVFTAENGCYGAKRVTAAINSDPANDDLFNHKRTARLMRQMGLFGYTKKRRVKTTVSAKRAPKLPDLLKRRFTAEKPNTIYVGDITYLPIAGRVEYVPGHRHRLLFAAVDRFRDRRPHAHGVGRRSSHDGPRGPRQP